MQIVLTNDDGFDAPGLAALHAAIRGLPGAIVRVIAPVSACSGKGHVVSQRFCCHDVEAPAIGRVTAVDGTPADCVRAALALPGEAKPDCVLSGINYGSNLGIDVYYSGTVAAAREAAILGIPSISISKLVKAEVPTDWGGMARLTAAILTALVAPDRPAPAEVDEPLHRATVALARSVSLEPGFWNVNLPCLLPESAPPVIELTSLSTDPFHILYDESRDENNRLCLTSKGNYHDRLASSGTDVAAVFAGKISLTRVLL